MKQQKNQSSSTSFIFGLISGLGSRFIVAPIERIVVLKQTNSISQYYEKGKNNNDLIILARIFKNEGIKGIFKGNGLNWLRVVPLTAFEFTFFDFFKKNLSYYIPTLQSNTINLLAGSFGGASAYAVVYPIDYCRTMVSINAIPAQTRFLNVFKYLYNRDGFFKMYRGLSATLLGTFPYCGLKFQAFEFLKNKRRIQKKSYKLNKIENLILGSMAGLFACTITYPLEILRKRRQVQILKNQTSNFSYIDLIKHIHKTQGTLGFFQGIFTVYLKAIPLTGSAFMINEFLKGKYQEKKQLIIYKYIESQLNWKQILITSKTIKNCIFQNSKKFRKSIIQKVNSRWYIMTCQIQSTCQVHSKTYQYQYILLFNNRKIKFHQQTYYKHQ